MGEIRGAVLAKTKDGLSLLLKKFGYKKGSPSKALEDLILLG